MKAYNLNAITYNASFGAVEVLKLGEEGRGRKITLVTCPKGLVDGENVTLFTPKVGKPKIGQGGETNSDQPCWLMRISAEGAYVRGANGNVRVLKGQEANVSVVSRGRGAFGDAGGVGSWDDLLMQVSPDTVLRVKPSRGDAYFLHITEAEIFKISTSEAEIYDVEIPLDTESYIRV
jgi:hypothetical protein